MLANAKTDQAKAQAEERKQKAAAKAEEATKQLDAAKADTKVAAAAAAKDARQAADKKKADLARAATDAKLAVEPVSIYISRATQKLYVRRNAHKPAPDGGGEVFDTSIEVPVTIRDAGKKIGTHIFTAMAKSDTGLRWSAVSIDGDDAKNALDRVSIPQEVLDRIGPTALPRSSIVISDRAAEQGNQLSHRVRHGTERPGRLHHTQADAGRRCGQQLVGRRRRFGSFFQPSPPPQPQRQRGGGQYYQQQQPGYYQQQQGYPPRPVYRQW